MHHRSVFLPSHTSRSTSRARGMFVIFGTVRGMGVRFWRLRFAWKLRYYFFFGIDTPLSFIDSFSYPFSLTPFFFPLPRDSSPLNLALGKQFPIRTADGRECGSRHTGSIPVSVAENAPSEEVRVGISTHLSLSCTRGNNDFPTTGKASGAERRESRKQQAEPDGVFVCCLFTVLPRYRNELGEADIAYLG